MCRPDVFDADVEIDTTTATQSTKNEVAPLIESPTGMPYVVKKPHANSKLILQNMEEVLNSVKKKHRQKHRRKREQKKLALMEAAEAANKVANGSNSNSSNNERMADEKHGKRRRRKSHQEKIAVQENGMSPSKRRINNAERKSPLKGMSSSANNTILKHFPRTPSKSDADAKPSAVLDDVTSLDVVAVASAPPKLTKPTNVFELMMNARNKSIGSNTSGHEAPDVTADAEDEKVSIKAKRKLMLQQWSERKGGVKRQLEEDQRTEYVEQKLHQRNKRFKRMLVNGNSPKSTTSIATSITATTENVQGDVNDDSRVKISKRRVRMPQARTRRLSSTNSLEASGTPTSPVVDVETAEFLAKLSSPTKKRDSLLGYFPKKASPKEQANKSVAVVTAHNDTPNSRSRRSNAAKHRTSYAASASVKASIVDENTTEDAAGVVNGNDDTHNGRPRRSCAGKTRYYAAYEQQSPPKSVKTRASGGKGCVALDDSEIEVIDLDDSIGAGGGGGGSQQMPAQTPKKLAPLFTRSLPKPSLDPALVQARQAFLMSGVPDKIRLEKERRHQLALAFDEAFEYFPRLCHVRQWNESDVAVSSGDSNSRCYKLRPETESEMTRIGGGKTRTRCALGSISACTPREFRISDSYLNRAAYLLAQYEPLQPLENKCAVIKEWKPAYTPFPTYKCYNQMREKYRYFSALDAGQDTQQVSESLVVTRRTRRSAAAQRQLDPEAVEEKPPMAAPNGELLFTEKYRPMMLEQVLVNLVPVTRLREFLGSWSDGGSGRNSQGLYADDSMDDSNSSQMGAGAACNTVVLLGPVSSGKTNAVFALANEMGFNVLEINAGMRRKGKRLIQELQEATQSHQVAKEQTKAQRHLLKMSLNGARRRQSQSVNDEGASGGEERGGARKCLILIEDADIVFEQHDAGFTDAIYTLASSSKRPVIIVASNPQSAHLQRLMQQHTIMFSAPNSTNISRFLSVLALMENCPVELDDIMSLYLYNGKDLRKTLLELQFYIQSGGDQQRFKIDNSARLCTPTKKLQSQQPSPSAAQQSPRFYASPSKRRPSQDDEQDPNMAEAATSADDQLPSNARQASAASGKLHMHGTLFEFYSTSQNQQWRIPFPVDFRLLRINLGGMFDVAKTLQLNTESMTATTTTTTKRRTRSPKKSSTSMAAISTPLDCLASFYECVSVSALLGASDAADLSSASIRDRLVAHPAEHMAHELVERSIEVLLGAPTCDYNLFDTPDECAISLTQYQGGASSHRGKRATALDYEPTLRTICRSERVRATQERRSTRFYHYLRNSNGYSVTACMDPLSTKHFDAACDVLQLPSSNAEDA